MCFIDVRIEFITFLLHFEMTIYCKVYSSNLYTKAE